MNDRLEARVSGEVQGVSFRYYTILEARRLGLTGWVGNERDGSVRVVAEGRASALEELKVFLWQGSPAANVSQVTEVWLPASGEFDLFSIRYL